MAAGLVPVDLNNIFITAPDAGAQVSQAEEEGWPRTVCAWIKGIYTTLQATPDIRTIVVVTQGDCSNTHALMELLQDEGRQLIPFQFPYPRHRDQLHDQIQTLMTACGTETGAVTAVWQQLQPLRAALAELDRLTWQTGQVSGRESFAFLIASSDFRGDPTTFGEELDDFLALARGRPCRYGGGPLGTHRHNLD